MQKGKKMDMILDFTCEIIWGNVNKVRFLEKKTFFATSVKSVNICVEKKQPEIQAQETPIEILSKSH